jgi:hypothetical protein
LQPPLRPSLWSLAASRKLLRLLTLWLLLLLTLLQLRLLTRWLLRLRMPLLPLLRLLTLPLLRLLRKRRNSNIPSREITKPGCDGMPFARAFLLGLRIRTDRS